MEEAIKKAEESLLKAEQAEKDNSATKAEIEALKQAAEKAAQEMNAIKAELQKLKAGALSETALTVNKKKVTLKPGKSVKLKVSSANGGKIKYRSKNKKIAKEDAKGKITGVRKGSTKVIVSCGKAKKTVKVIVK